MAGIPGSGKSTLAERLARERCAVLVSTDRLREELTGSAEDRSRDGAVFGRAMAEIRRNLSGGANVVYDATNLTAGARRRALKAVPPGVRKICWYLPIDLEQAQARNAARERVVPRDVIAGMSARLQEPEMREGWDEIRRFGA